MISRIRAKFPQTETPPIHMDNAGGTYMVSAAASKIIQYLQPSAIEKKYSSPQILGENVSKDEIVQLNRLAIKELISARDASEIVFGPNMSTLTFQISRSFGRALKPGDCIAVTRLDHDANISPWVLMAEERGCEVSWIDFYREDFSLDMQSLAAVLARKPKLVAFTCASNVMGAVPPIKEIITLCHDAGALVYLDAVQYAPHYPIDVQDWNCDFLVFSLHKLFGPHMGLLYGRHDLLDRMFAYQVQSGNVLPPGKFETGNQKSESIYGLPGVIEYLEWLGVQHNRDQTASISSKPISRLQNLKQAYQFIQSYEQTLKSAFLAALKEIPNIEIITDVREGDLHAVPIFSFLVKGIAPYEVEKQLLAEGIKLWSGHFHASEVTKHLGKNDGLVRASLAHYNTVEEIKQFIEALTKIALSTV